MNSFSIVLALQICLIGLLSMAASAQQDGPVTIGGIVYDSVDPGPAFAHKPEAPMTWPKPEPTADEAKAGLMSYVTSDPGYYSPERYPKAHEHVQSLSTFLTPGEDRAVWFAVYTLSDTSGLTVSVDKSDLPAEVDVRHIHFWPQRTQWKSREWYITPELLLPCGKGKRWVPAKRGVLQEEPFDIKTGQTAGFWLTVSAPADAKSGRYTTVVTVKAKGKSALKLPLQVEILPFKLKEPKDRRWMLYADSVRWKTMSDPQILRELRDFRRHGFTSLIEISPGTVDLAPLKTGRKPVFDASSYKKITRLSRKAGVNGPHVISIGKIPERVAEALGIEVDLHSGDWPAEVKKGVEAVARAAMQATENEAEWQYYGVDEPSGDNTYAVQDYECWRKAGAKTYATVLSSEFLSKSTDYVTAPCFVAPMVASQAESTRLRTLCEKANAEFTWYGTGCYVNPFPQERYMYHNRYGAGFYFWKTRAVGAVAWTFCRPHEDVFNDFDGSAQNSFEPKEQAFAYPHLLKESDWSTYQGAIPTIAWEAHREGYNDYLYLYTLTTLIQERQRKGTSSVKVEANDAQDRLTRIIEEIPWANILADVAFDPAKIEESRRAIANLILKLR